MLIARCAIVLALVVAGGAAEVQSPMTRAALQLTRTLEGDAAEAAMLPWNSDAQRDWHFIPRRADGVTFNTLNDEQRRGVHALMRSVLSDTGYAKATGIMHLEGVLQEIESTPERPATWRDPGLYRLAIFGEPGDEARWGWKVEGHHLSLNFTSGAGGAVSATPSFFGTNPDEVLTGMHAGWMVLEKERTIGIALHAALTDEQRAAAALAQTPRDIVAGPNRSKQIPVTGIAAIDLDDAQQDLLRELVTTYVDRLRRDLADRYLDRMLGDGLAGLHFAWAGDPDGRFYYRVRGDSWVIEYDVVDRNHVHTVWRDFEHDFGGDPLTEHHADHAH